MPNMSLGGVTFAANPSKSNGIIDPVKRASHLPTYGGVAYYSFGVTIVGREVVLTWRHMALALWAQLTALYQADLPVVFVPQDGSGKSYQVEIEGLTGDYFIGLDGPRYRSAVKLTLIVLEVL